MHGTFSGFRAGLPASRRRTVPAHGSCVPRPRCGSLEFEHQVIVEHEHGDGDAQAHDRGDERFPDARRQLRGVGGAVFRDGADTVTMPRMVPSRPSSGETTEMSLTPAQPFRDLFEIAVEQVATSARMSSEWPPWVFTTSRIMAIQRIVALIAHIAHTAAFLVLNVEKVPLEVAPDEMQIQKVPQREVQSRTTDKNQRDAGRPMDA